MVQVPYKLYQYVLCTLSLFAIVLKLLACVLYLLKLTAFEELQMIEQQRQDELLRSQQTSASTPRNVNPNSMFRFGESVVPQAKQQYVRDFCARCRVLCFVLEKVFHGGHTHVHLMDDTFVVDI
ncbi:unnamed protein product [Amaranthus hypochondriacus]